MLINDSRLEIRLLSRDMDKFYFKTISNILFQPQLLNRIKFVNISRNISKIVNDFNINIITRCSTETINKASEILFIDIGYYGTIPKHTYQIFTKHFGSKYKWILIWKDLAAPKYINNFDDKFKNYLINKFPIFKNLKVYAMCKHSFRNAVFEYQNKWLSEINSLNIYPIYLVTNLANLCNDLLEELDVYTKKDILKIFLISNEEIRKDNYLKLKEKKVSYFYNTFDFCSFRKIQNISSESPVIFVSNKNINIQNSKDIYINSSNKNYTTKYISDTIYNSFFNIKPAPLKNQLTVIAEIINNF